MAARTARRGSRSPGGGIQCRTMDVRSVEQECRSGDPAVAPYGAGGVTRADTKWTLLCPWRSPRLGPLASTTRARTGPRLFDGPFPGPQRVCVLCMLERARWCLRQRDAELAFVAGLLGDSRYSLEPTMTERDVLAGELESANQRISHLQAQVEQVIAPRLSRPVSCGRV